jgi:TIR domain
VRVFLSYRRRDAGAYAGRLADVLLQRLGPRSVFQDVTAISPGQDFTVAIDRALAESDVALVLIGPDWLKAATPQGTRRLLEVDDYVRLELARALQRDIRVIPVLVGGARLPAAAELPDDLRGVAQRQAVELHDETWHQDVDGLIRSLRGQPAVPAGRRRRWLVAGTALAALLALGAGAWWQWGPGSGNTGKQTGSGSGGQTGPATAIGPCPPTAGQAWAQIALSNNPTGVDKANPGGSLVFRVKSARWRALNGKWQVILTVSVKNNTGHAVSTDASRYNYLQVEQRPFNVTCFLPESASVDSGGSDNEFVGFDVTCKPTVPIRLVLESGIINVTPATLDSGSC